MPIWNVCRIYIYRNVSIIIIWDNISSFMNTREMILLQKSVIILFHLTLCLKSQSCQRKMVHLRSIIGLIIVWKPNWSDIISPCNQWTITLMSNTVVAILWTVKVRGYNLGGLQQVLNTNDRRCSVIYLLHFQFMKVCVTSTMVKITKYQMAEWIIVWMRGQSLIGSHYQAWPLQFLQKTIRHSWKYDK